MATFILPASLQVLSTHLLSEYVVVETCGCAFYNVLKIGSDRRPVTKSAQLNVKFCF